MDFNQLEIIYEDNHLLVVNKPAGLLTQPNETSEQSLEELAKQWIKQKYNKPHQVFLQAVHRLDKPVSGIVVFGKTSKSVSRLNDAIRNKETKKVYEAIVEGVPSTPEAVLEHYLIHDDYRAEIVKATSPNAKLAQLSYRVIERQENQSRLEIILITGRYHQIRVQLSAIGCPILGDTKYGSHQPYKPGAIALCHKELQLIHPVTKEVLTLRCSS